MADDARRAARRAASTAAVAAIGGGTGRALWAQDGYSISARGLRVNEDGCLVVQHVTVFDAGGRAAKLDLPIIVANLPHEPSPTEALGAVLLGLVKGE